MKEIFFLSGLPRSGSTLLSSILSQNKAIHTEATSALCQLMWDMQVSCWNTEQMPNKPQIEEKILKAIPKVFYEDVSQSIIIDKCRTWPAPANLEMIDKYITKNPKIIITVRPIIEVVKSFVYIRTLNGYAEPEANILDEHSMIMRSVEAVKYARTDNSGKFLFVTYDDLVDQPQIEISRIYDFCGWDSYVHQYENIQNTTPDRDDLLGLIGLHDIRPEIKRRVFDVELSDDLFEKAMELNETLGWISVKS